jgi:hypothetical protein
MTGIRDQGGLAAAALPKIRGLGMTLDAHRVFSFSLAQNATKTLLIPEPLIPVIRSLIGDASHQNIKSFTTGGLHPPYSKPSS